MIIFDTPMQAADALALQGWVVSDNVRELVRVVLGSDGIPVPFPLGGENEWSVARKDGRNLPLGPPSALIALRGPFESVVEIGMGSQASSSAPVDRLRTWTILFRDGEMAVLDARCWFRPKAGQISASLWVPQSFRDPEEVL
jgi:hypothetical protein